MHAGVEENRRNMLGEVSLTEWHNTKAIVTAPPTLWPLKHPMGLVCLT
jgi:hypothetical protein